MRLEKIVEKVKLSVRQDRSEIDISIEQAQAEAD